MKKKVLVSTILALFSVSFIFAKEKPIVKDINAENSSGTKISITWTLPENTDSKITKIFVYKSLKPIGSFYDLAETKPIAELKPNATSFSDNVKDYNDYYYSVICEADGNLFDIVLPSINSTVNGTHLRLPERKAETEVSVQKDEKMYSMESLRETPLPYLDFLESQGKTPLKMSNKAIAAAKELAGSNSMNEKPISEPYVFEEDLIAPDGGDDFLLFEVLRTTFIQKKYGQAINQLEKLINTNRSANVESRAKFYLAESYYFTKNYEEAAENFLSVYDDYPSLSKRWIESSLDLYKIPKNAENQ